MKVIRLAVTLVAGSMLWGASAAGAQTVSAPVQVAQEAEAPICDLYCAVLFNNETGEPIGKACLQNWHGTHNYDLGSHCYATVTWCYTICNQVTPPVPFLEEFGATLGFRALCPQVGIAQETARFDEVVAVTVSGWVGTPSRRGEE